MSLFRRVRYKAGPTKKLLRYQHFRQNEIADTKGYLFIPGNLDRKRLVIQKVKLSTGGLKQYFIDGDGHGHSIVLCEHSQTGWLIPENGRFAIEFDVKNLKPRYKIHTKNNRFGGHGACSLNGERLYFVDRNLENRQESNLVIYDTKRRRRVSIIEQVGIGAHDVKITKDEQFAIVASFGRIINLISHDKLSGRNSLSADPSFAIIDLKKRKVLIKRIYTDDFMLAHVVLDKEEKNAFIQGTAVQFLDQLKQEEIDNLLKARAKPLTQEEEDARIIFCPGIQLKINLVNGKDEKLRQNNFYRTQAFIRLQHSNILFESHGVSQEITVVNGDDYQITKVIDCLKSGMDDPRGLAMTQDQKYLVVVGRQNNIHFFDPKSGTFILNRSFYSLNYRNSHISILAE